MTRCIFGLVLTIRRSRPPSASAEIRALVPSYSALCRPAFIPALRQSQRFLLWSFGAAPGFACLHCASFKPFGPPALVQQALPAIFLAALRRFRGPALFPGPRTSSRLGAPFWPSGLTLRSSGRLRRRLPWFVRNSHEVGEEVEQEICRKISLSTYRVSGQCLCKRN